MEPSLYLRLFSRRPYDSLGAANQLKFLTGFADRIFLPEECGPYDPFQPFDENSFPTYVSWLMHPAGEFGFRRARSPFPVEGDLANRLFPEILERDPGSRVLRPLPPVPPPPFPVRWSMHIGEFTGTGRDASLMERFLIEACHTAEADYGFVALYSDYQRKHVSVTRRGDTTIQQNLGEDPDRGIPGLYWMNFFGPLYVDWFGKEKWAAVSKLTTETVHLPGDALLLRFEDAHSASESQSSAIRILGQDAFFDITHPDRILAVPPALR